MSCVTDLGLVIYTRKYRERSLLVDFLTLNCGKLHLIAKSSLMKIIGCGVLQPFCVLNISWSNGKGNFLELNNVERVSDVYNLNIPYFFIGMYLNELIYKLGVGIEESDKIFAQYLKVLEELAKSRIDKRSLRIFELTLLGSIGYTVNLRYKASDFNKDEVYEYKFAEGFVIAQKGGLILGPCFKGEELYNWYYQGANLENRILQEITSYSLSCLLRGNKLQSRRLYKQFLEKTK